jgi:hypothetical protein
MTGISGKNGKVQIVSSDVAECTGWTFNPTSNNPSWGSCDGGGYKQRVAGVKDGSGSIEGKFNPDDPIYDHLEEGTSVVLKLYINATAYYRVPAIIDSFSLEVDMDDGDVVGWSADFSTNGAWTKPV